MGCKFRVLLKMLAVVHCLHLGECSDGQSAAMLPCYGGLAGSNARMRFWTFCRHWNSGQAGLLQVPVMDHVGWLQRVWAES